MPEYDITKKSRPVVVTAYQFRWASDFTQIARRIRELVGDAAIRIDHIGSTAVPGLGAKDIIDLTFPCPCQECQRRRETV